MDTSARLFEDRRDAGRKLAAQLQRFRGSDALVLGLVRGGVPVAYEVAEELELELDVFVVRKLGHPTQPELAVGAVASGGVLVLNDEISRTLADDSLDRIIAQESAELLRRERAFRGESPQAEVSGRTVIIIDDGLATGASMFAAVRALRASRAREIVAAVPLAPEQTRELLEREADEVICLYTPSPFVSVGSWYEDFEQVSDAEATRLLRASVRVKEGER